MFISFSWKHGTICVENPPIVANYYCSSSVCIYEHAASEIETYQNVMTVPIKAVLQVAVHIICHQMGDAIIVAIVVQWSWVVHGNHQLGEAHILQAEFLGDCTEHGSQFDGKCNEGLLPYKSDHCVQEFVVKFLRRHH